MDYYRRHTLELPLAFLDKLKESAARLAAEYNRKYVFVFEEIKRWCDSFIYDDAEMGGLPLMIADKRGRMLPYLCAHHSRLELLTNRAIAIVERGISSKNQRLSSKDLIKTSNFSVKGVTTQRPHRKFTISKEFNSVVLRSNKLHLNERQAHALRLLHQRLEKKPTDPWLSQKKVMSSILKGNNYAGSLRDIFKSRRAVWKALIIKHPSEKGLIKLKPVIILRHPI